MNPPPQNTKNASSAASSKSELLAELEKIPAEQVVEALKSCLSATAISRNGASAPDYRTRLAAASLILDHQLGKPLQRSENVVVDATPINDAQARLDASPAMRRALAEMLGVVIDV